MSAPELDTDDDTAADTDGADVISEFDGEEDPDGTSGDVVEVGEADLGLDDDNGIVAGFDGFEDSDNGGTGSENASTDSSSGGGGGPTIQSAIEEGMAEVAAIGLRGQDRKRVRSEMQAIASQFKLGYFGERCAEKYLQKDLDEIPPEYGLAAALIAFLAVAVYKRPDGTHKAKEAFASLKATVAGSPEPTPEPDPEPDADDEDDDE